MKNEHEQLANENESFRRMREVTESGNREGIEDFHRARRAEMMAEDGPIESAEAGWEAGKALAHVGEDDVLPTTAQDDTDGAREAWKARAKQARAGDPHG